MKNLKYLSGILFLSVLLIIQITSCGGGGGGETTTTPVISVTPGPPFLKSDLAGTWHIFATNGEITAKNIFQGNLMGTLNIDSLGQVSGVSFTRSSYSSGWSTPIKDGLITIDSTTGVLGGSYGNSATSYGVYFYIGSGKMDSSKNIMCFVTSTIDGEFDFFTAIRDGGSFASSDLVSTWYIYGTSGTYAKMTISDAGNGIAGLIDINSGKGSLNIDGSGLLTGGGYVTTNLDPVYLLITNVNGNLEKGKMNSSKDMMSFAATDSTLGIFDLATAIHDGGNFTSPADLVGTWYIYGTSRKVTVTTDITTISGTIVLDPSGQVTGSYTYSNSNSIPNTGTASFTGGSITIDATGVLSGSATTNIGDNIILSSGKMNSSKSMMAFVASKNLDELDFLICLKGS